MKSSFKLSGLTIFAIVFIVVLFLTQSVFAAGMTGLFASMFVPSGSSGQNKRGADKLNYTHEILALVSVILTKDKKVLQSELNYVKRFLNRNFSEDEAQQYLLKFREYTQKSLSVEKICIKLNQVLDISEKRQILHLVIGAAVADRELTEAELYEIYKIGQHLRINKITVDSLLSMHSFTFKGQQQNRQQQYRRRSSTTTSLSQAYKILEITPQATEKEVKKAYRKLAVIYHPDKVMNMGKNYQNSAKEKFQKIQAAYEQIKTARGIK